MPPTPPPPPPSRRRLRQWRWCWIILLVWVLGWSVSQVYLFWVSHYHPSDDDAVFLLLLGPSKKKKHDAKQTPVMTQTYQSSSLVSSSSFWYQPNDDVATGDDNNNNDNKVIYVGMFGLGHRFSKLAAAYHWVRRQASQSTTTSGCPVTNLEVLWGTCSHPNEPKNHHHNNNNDKNNNQTQQPSLDIFTFLFGHNRIRVVDDGGDRGWSSSLENNDDGDENLHYNTTMSKNNDSHSNQDTSRRSYRQQGKSLVIRNDVVGYYAGQNFKNARIPVSQIPLSLWHDKLQSDNVLFRHLLHAFAQRQDELLAESNTHATTTKTTTTTLQSFQQQVHWSQHYVIGLHVRAGNGEQDHFQQAQRQIDDDTFYRNLVATIRSFLNQLNQYEQQEQQEVEKKSPLIFLATDTAGVESKLQQYFSSSSSSSSTSSTTTTVSSIPLVTVPQPRVPEQQGVSYSAWTAGSQHCWDGWWYSMLDMALLAQANVVIAARRSTFTQIVPRATVLPLSLSSTSMSLDYYSFCEVGNTGAVMTCFTNTDSWLFRGVVANRAPNERTHPLPTTRREQYQQEFHTKKGRSTTLPPIQTFAAGAAGATREQQEDEEENGVVHKVMVHFPDISMASSSSSSSNRWREDAGHIHPKRMVEKNDDPDHLQEWIQRAQEFFQTPVESPPDQKDSSDRRMLYGYKINRKYRGGNQVVQNQWVRDP